MLARACKEASFDEKINYVLNFCQQRIMGKMALPFQGAIEKDNSYLTIVRAIYDYLSAYKQKQNFQQVLKVGYDHFNEYSASHYIPTFELCQKDALNETDLECALQIANHSFYLPNHQFVESAISLLQSKFAITEDQLNHSKTSDAEYYSNGFKYYLEGELEAVNKAWLKQFNDPKMPKHVHDWTVNANGFMGGLTLGSFAFYGPLQGIAFLLATAALYKTQGLVSDKIALNFFNQIEPSDDYFGKRSSSINEPAEKPEKHHNKPDAVFISSRRH